MGPRFLLPHIHPPASHAEVLAGPKASFSLFTWGRFLFTSLFISPLPVIVTVPGGKRRGG